MFCGGSLTAIFGILLCTFVLLDRPNGPELAGAWSCRESFVAVFISNLPIMYPIIHRFFRNLASKVYTGPNLHSEGTSSNKSLGATNFKKSTLSKSSRKKGKYEHPLSLPPETLYTRFGSEEEIVDKERMVGVETTQTTQASKEKRSSLPSSLVRAGSFPQVMVTREFEMRLSLQESSEGEGKSGKNSSIY